MAAIELRSSANASSSSGSPFQVPLPGGLVCAAVQPGRFGRALKVRRRLGCLLDALEELVALLLRRCDHELLITRARSSPSRAGSAPPLEIASPISSADVRVTHGVTVMARTIDQLRRELEGCERQLGADHADTLVSVSNLAMLLQAQGKFDEAEPLFRRALAGREQQLGAHHPDTLTSVNNLA